MAKPSPPPLPLTIRTSGVQFVRTGLRAAPWDDLYHRMLRSSWAVFMAQLLVAFLLVNMAFAVLYRLGGDCIGAEDPTSFLQSFSFSVQTFATIGYGVMSPKTPYAHVVVALESFVGTVYTALIAGLCYGKFARPEARVQFSKVAVVTRRNGQAVLMFRMANERSSRIVDARVQVDVLIDELSLEGERMRRFYPLVLERDRSPTFLMSWSVLHPIDERSPLLGMSPASPERTFVSLVVTMTGTEESLAQSVHRQHYYLPADLRFGHRFVDILYDAGGVMGLDHAKLDDTEPEAAGAAPSEPRADREHGVSAGRVPEAANTE